MASTEITVFLGICLGLISAVQSDFSKECLFAHNKARGQHVNTPKLTWDAELAKSATAYAKTLAGINQRSSAYSIKHSPGSGVHYGENIYAGTSGGFDERNIAHAMYFWYREGIGYNYQNPTPWTSTGHFTQVIWKSTTTVGCGKVLYFKDMRIHTIIVCQYKPKGNVSMRYILNVMNLKPGGKDKLSVEELTGVEQVTDGGCSHTDAVPLACEGMKPYCNDQSNTHLMQYLQENCKKTCYC